MSDPVPFELRGVVHLLRPWGTPAHDLEQLRQGVVAAGAEVIFRHAVQYRLRHPVAEEQPRDDFTAWVGGVLQDAETAERVTFAVQSHGGSVEALRSGLLEVLDSIPEKKRAAHAAPEGSPFLWMSATSLSYPIGVLAHDGPGLVDALVQSDVDVWFYHLVEEPWYGGGQAPLTDWLAAIGETKLAAWLVEAAGAGLAVDKARERFLRRWRQSRIARRVADATRVPEDARREAGRQAVARLVRHGRAEDAS